MRAATDHPVRAAQALAPLVDARLACGDLAGAQRRRRPRSATSPTGAGIRLVTALAELATARVTAAGDEPGGAAPPAQRALVEFGRLAMPFEAAQARLELARALGGSAPALACDEARSALAVFRSLGAARAADVAAALLRGLGVRRRHRGSALPAS